MLDQDARGVEQSLDGGVLGEDGDGIVVIGQLKEIDLDVAVVVARDGKAQADAVAVTVLDALQLP